MQSQIKDACPLREVVERTGVRSSVGGKGLSAPHRHHASTSLALPAPPIFSRALMSKVKHHPRQIKAIRTLNTKIASVRLRWLG